mmetsp:Transcript_3962/g.14989  ORF Transcript_3962/g.14989 Transcript_3962/m.14989 type:complete len:89 (+) Transcript_3962:474-740(+)
MVFLVTELECSQSCGEQGPHCRNNASALFANKAAGSSFLFPLGSLYRKMHARGQYVDMERQGIFVAPDGRQVIFKPQFRTPGAPLTFL